MKENDYVLGTSDCEVQRLYLQHYAWRSYVFDAWRRAGFHRGQVLLDLGCGPGAATLDLAELVGSQGRIYAVDRSPTFIEVLERSAERRGLSNIMTICSDVLDYVPAFSMDGIWSRWLLSFLPDPAKFLRVLRTWCEPGGTLVLHEYYDYGAWRMFPELPELTEFVALVMKSWRMSGGEPDLGLALPAMLSTSGFKLIETRCISNIVMMDDSFWEWLKAFVVSGLKRLQELGNLSEARAREMDAAFLKAENTSNTRMVSPAVIEIIARAEVAAWR